MNQQDWELLIDLDKELDLGPLGLTKEHLALYRRLLTEFVAEHIALPPPQVSYVPKWCRIGAA